MSEYPRSAALDVLRRIRFQVQNKDEYGSETQKDVVRIVESFVPAYLGIGGNFDGVMQEMSCKYTGPELSKWKETFEDNVGETIDMILGTEDPVETLVQERNKRWGNQGVNEAGMILSPLSSGILVVATIARELRRRGVDLPPVFPAVTGAKGEAWLPSVQAPRSVIILDDFVQGRNTQIAVEAEVARKWPGTKIIR